MNRLIDANNLMEYCLNQKDKTVDCNDIARFPTILTIPDNPTNGDVIKAVLDITDMWTGLYIPTKQKQVYIKMVGSEDVTSFDADWWNSPYKRGDTDEHN